MKFYGRSTELTALYQSYERSQRSSQMTVVTGRRRIGKTRLILRALEERDYLYLFVSKKAEKLLCQDFLRQIETVYGETPVGEVSTFPQVFDLLCRLASRQHINVVIDEFQEFSSVNASIYSDLQRDWDLQKQSMRMNLILCGSVQSMMDKIFLDAREPLFGRASSVLTVTPFRVSTLRQILADYSPGFTAEDLLALYTITGGVAQYVEWLMEDGAFTRQTMLDAVFRPRSVFLNEGRSALIQDLGKGYTIYFSILSLIAAGFTSRPQIESVLQLPVGGQIQRLERVYRILKRRRPIFSKENSTTIRFYLADNFFRFWFRFIFKFQDMIEANNLPAVRSIVDRDFRTFAGLSLEDLLREQLRESQRFTRIGNYWERNNQLEIDVVAVNELERTAVIGEVKWQRRRANVPKLEVKADKLIREHLKAYAVTFLPFGLEDVIVE
ncbi:MAG: ATP-binding protein [Bacteroidota bacterium]